MAQLVEDGLETPGVEGGSVPNRASANFSDEEKLCFDKLKSQIQKLNEMNKRNEQIINETSEKFKECQHECIAQFDSMIAVIKNRQQALLGDIQKIHSKNLSVISQRITTVKDHVFELKQFEQEWNEFALNKAKMNNDEPGQSNENNYMTKCHLLLQKIQSIDAKVPNAGPISLSFDKNKTESICALISKLGNVDCSQPLNAPCLRTVYVEDCSVNVKINLNNDPSAIQSYVIEMSENNQNENDDQKQGEMYDENIKWNQVISKSQIDEGIMYDIINNLKPKTRYLLKCKCTDSYNKWSAYSKWISFMTIEKKIEIDSAILNHEQYKVYIQNNFKKDPKLKLLYRASKDGFHGSDFHSKCDGKKKTIVVIKSKTGNIFGGYTKVAWSSDGKWHRDATFFLFDKNGTYAIKQSQANKAVKHYSGHGPCFGAGHDLLIVNDANHIASRSAAKSFIDLKGDRMTGSKIKKENKWEFGVVDYEVFQLC